MQIVEQKVVVVPATESDINTSLTTENPNEWVCGTIVISGSDAIIIYSRQYTAP